MSRAIKFRAWDEEEKRMFHDVLVASNGNYIGLRYTADEYELECQYACYDNSAGTIHLMQYTGLKDKNGNEIYEGDLIKFSNDNIGEVTFNNGAFQAFDEPLGYDSLDDIDSDVRKIGTFDTTKYCEIIGNIHSTPELLNQ